MDDELESLRQEIFRVHGVSVGKNDPVMILYTLNKELLTAGKKAQEEQLEQFKSELEGIAYQWGNDAKEKAERILNASLSASKEAMASLMKASAAEATTAMQVELEKAVRRAQAPVYSARHLFVLSTAASIITLIAAVLVAWSSLH
ncbi:conjugal transfer protein TraM [Escherichia coli]|nr:conjugal transfer protein TraM [Escherichia coli]